MSPRPLLSPEAKLVFRTAADNVTAAEWATLAGAVMDWPRVLALAEFQLASLPLWRALESSPEAKSLAPADFAESLCHVAVQGDLRMQQLARRAQQTVEALRAAGVATLLLKGAALGALRDPTFGTRPMTDVDLLVRRADATRATDALVAAGWCMTENPVYLEMLQGAHHLPHFVDPTLPGRRLELHVALMPEDQPFGIDEELFWAAAQPAVHPFAGAYVPSPEHLLLHTAVHFAWQHTLAFGAWRTFRAVQIAIALPTLDWDRFIEEASRTKGRSSAYWTLRMSTQLAGIAIPAAVLSALQPPTPEFVLKSLERHYAALNAPGERPSSPSESLTRYLWFAALRPRWSGHGDPGRYDPENRWAKAKGRASTETSAQRYLRHVRQLGAWVRFVRETLLG